MNVKVDCLLELWGSEVGRRRYEAAVPSSLAGLVGNGGMLARSGSPGSKCLLEAGRYMVLSSSTQAVDRHLLAMFEEAPKGLGASRAGSLYRLARARYVAMPRLLVAEQCKLLGVSRATYQRWLDTLHDYLADGLSKDVSMRDAWAELDRLSEIKAAS